VTNIWENYYKNNNEIIVESNETDELLAHVFKKQKIESSDELKTFLKEEVIDFTTDILQWWKVCLLN
jgi:hypothetical protein